jgi:aminopeptidase N
MPSYEEQWLTESFAEYSAALFMKAFKGQGAYDNLVRRWKAAAIQASDVAPIPLANRVSIPSDYFTAYTLRAGLLYSKGAYLLSALHRELGDETFLTFLKSYQKSFRWKFGSTHRRRPPGVVDPQELCPLLRGEFLGDGDAAVRAVRRGRSR